MYFQNPSSYDKQGMREEIKKVNKKDPCTPTVLV